MTMNAEEFKMTRQRLQMENRDFFNSIYNLIKHAEAVEQKAQEQYAEGYQKGLEDAWTMVWEIVTTKEEGGMSSDELRKCFGTYRYTEVLCMTVSEVKAKYDAWKAKKEQDDEIQVGDVVVWNTLYEKMIVIKKVNDHYGLIYLSDGSYDVSDGCYLIKTGEHYDLPWQEQCQ